MDELEMIGKAVSIKFSTCTVINTGDLLAGKSGATRHEILDAMIAHWMSDPVHGTKTGYSKLAMKLAERVEADLIPKTLAKRTTSKKRAASPEAGSSGSGPSPSSRNIRGRGGPDNNRRDSASYTYNPDAVEQCPLHPDSGRASSGTSPSTPAFGTSPSPPGTEWPSCPLRLS
jgi:hypothetical protein